MNIDTKKESNSDLDLIKKISRGDEDAFKQLVERYYKMVYYICLKYLKQKEDAQDATQEVFWKVWKNINLCSDSRYLASWIKSIATHHCIDIVRKNKLRLNQEVSLDNFDNPENFIGNEEVSKTISQKIAFEYIYDLTQQLPEPQREVFRKRLEGKMVQEIAEELQCPLGTVLSRIALAKKKMFELMKEANVSWDDF